MKINEYLIERNTTVREAMQMLNQAKRALFVVENQKIIGSVTDGDIRRWILSSGGLDQSISKVMFTNPQTIRIEQIQNAQALMIQHQVLALPVVNEQDEVIDLIFWKGIKKNDFHKINASVIIMAGGKGQRLLPYTSIVPKPLIPIGEKPIVELIIDSFHKFGCYDYYLSINYKKNMIKAYFEDFDKDYKITYIEEDVPLGTGGSLYYLKGKMADTFFVSNCDILLDVDYSDILEFHKKHQNMITVVTSLKHYEVPYGVINLNPSGHVQSIVEKPTSDYLVNTGMYVIEPEILQLLKKNEFIHLTDLIERCIYANKQVGTYPIREDAWMDMGQLGDMEKMKEMLRREQL